MKKLICAVLSLILTVSLLASCSKKEKLLGLEYGEEGLLVCENGDTYKYAPLTAYEPTNQGTEYGVITVRSESGATREEKVYRIGEEDPGKWLTTEYTGGTTIVYYSQDITLPTLADFEPQLCYICEEEEAVFSIYTIGDPANKAIDAERAILNDVLSIVLDESTEPELWPRINMDESYGLKLYSEKWPAVYYCLEYVREGGVGYIYDPVSNKCVNVGTVLERYFVNEADE
ncbi:MAG: hypothetical protein IKL24_02070 [Clostridia bacterium]|nr:hypothetical protein [Clostridia bacterium]